MKMVVINIMFNKRDQAGYCYEGCHLSVEFIFHIFHLLWSARILESQLTYCKCDFDIDQCVCDIRFCWTTTFRSSSVEKCLTLLWTCFSIMTSLCSALSARLRLDSVAPLLRFKRPFFLWSQLCPFPALYFLHVLHKYNGECFYQCGILFHCVIPC